MPEQESDFSELLSRVRSGSEEAAWELVERYGEQIRRAVRRLLNQRLRSKFDSLDFVQLVWSSLFRARSRLDRFDRPEELAAFLVTMARNKVGMEVRRRLRTAKYNVNRERSIEEGKSGARMEIASRDPPPIEVAIARERWAGILEGQPERYRRIIELRLQGHTCQEIADSVQVAECTVRRYLKRLSRETVG
jgi:RNA polymerase sigma-70 factor (ECF subfamily)